MWNFLIHHSRGLFISGIFGLLFFFMFYYQVPTTDNHEVIINRFEALKHARENLHSFGYDLTDFSTEYTFRSDNATRWYLTRQLGAGQAQTCLANRLIVNDAWHFRFFQDLPRDAPQESYEVRLSPQGDLLYLFHRIPEAAPGEAFSEPEALNLANEFMKRNKILDSLDYQIKTNSIKKKNRTDFNIHYTYTDSLLNGDFEYIVTIQGNKLDGYSRRFIIPAEAEGIFQALMNTKNRFYDFLAPVFMLLFIWLIIEFIKRYHVGEIGEKNGFYLLLIVGFVIIGGTLNSLIGTAYNWHIGAKTRSQVQLAVAMQELFTEDIVVSLVIYFAFLVGESLLRTKQQMGKLLSIDALFAKKWQTVNVAQSLTRGFFSAGILLGLVTLLALVFKAIFNAIPLQHPFVAAFDDFFPWIEPILTGTARSFIGAIVTLLFLTTILQRYFKSKLISVLPFFLISIGINLFDLYFVPVYFDFIFCLLIGTGFVVIFRKFDLLTTIISFFVFGTLLRAQPLMQTMNGFFILSGLSATIVGLTPLFFAFLGFKSQRFFQIQENKMPAYIKRITERERMTRELEIARSIQSQLLPQATPVFKNLDIKATCIPARETGGDYFEFTQLNKHQLGFCIGDVSGKGVPAAIYMTLTKGIFLSYSEASLSPRTVLSKVNRQLYRIMDRGHFVSMLYGVYDSEEMSLTLARAGHNPGIWYHGQQDQYNLLEPSGMALGLEEGPLFDNVLVEEKIFLKPGDTLVFYTDGFSEARNANWEEFGEQRLIQLLKMHENATAAQMLHQVMTEIKTFIHQQSQQDDMTMLIVKVR